MDNKRKFNITCESDEDDFEKILNYDETIIQPIVVISSTNHNNLELINSRIPHQQSAPTTSLLNNNNVEISD